MNLPLYIAKRYLFAKKSHKAVNIISLVSICGIATATMAIICVLSIFNGFSEVAASTFNFFDPELKILPAQGKVFDSNDPNILKVKGLNNIDFSSESLEENALLKFEDRQKPIILKGVSSDFKQLVDIDKLIIDGKFALREGEVDNAIIGAELAMYMGVRANFLSPLEIYVPNRTAKSVNVLNPSTAFSHSDAYTSGVFALNPPQPKYDGQMLIVSIDLVRELLKYDTEISSLDIKVKAGVSVDKVQKEIKDILGDQYLVKNRFEQQEDVYRMVNIEKWVTFLILAIVLIIAIFNIVGSLSMLILEKTDDIQIFRNLGANNSFITQVFMIEGWLITSIGAVVGLLLGIGLCLIQQHFGILKLGDGGVYAIDYYPVSVEVLDVLIVLVTVSVVGFLAVLYPVNNLRKRLSFK